MFKDYDPNSNLLETFVLPLEKPEMGICEKSLSNIPQTHILTLLERKASLALGQK